MRPTRFGKAPNHAQRGATVILALLTATLVAIIAARLISEQDRWQRQVVLTGDRMQANALAHAGMRYAMAVLADDLRISTIDHAEEVWARPLPPMTVEGGQLAGRIRDLQGRINLNDAGSLPLDVSASDKALPRLFALLELPPALLASLADWIDANDEARSQGAEDAYYLGLAKPYRTANRPLISVDELRFVRGFNADIIARLRPHVATLPPGTLINVNTASALVLQAATATLSAEQARALRASADLRPLQSIEDFVDRALALESDRPPSAGFSVSSLWFELVGEVRWGEAFSRMHIVVERQGSGRIPRVTWETVH